jgi:hypothetical protein
MAVTVGFAGWAAWLGGLGREERAVAARSAEL